MNPMKKMMLEEKETLKKEILELFNSFNKGTFLEELNEKGIAKLEELGILHSFNIKLGIYENEIYVYIDDKPYLRYSF